MESYRTLSVARLGTVQYLAALELQDAMVRARLAEKIGDTLLLLEHPHVYTLGRGADPRFLLHPSAEVPVHRVSRGGQVTYHGPGQLVGYPILQLAGRARDVGKYLRNLEQTMIVALSGFGIKAARREGFTGVWIGDRKIASIGVGLRHWVTFHGFALNVCADLSRFNEIVPCGIAGCRMTSLAELGRASLSVADFAAAIERSFSAVFTYDRTAAVEPASIWRLVDRPAPACEAIG